MRILKFYLFLLCILGSPLVSTAQNKFNLNFNEFDSAEQSMPKGWYKYGGFDIIKGEKESDGNIVGKVVSDENGKFGFIMNRFLANYAGDTIELTGRIKYEKVKDYVGLIMWIDGEKSGYHLVFESMQNRHIRGSSDWTEYSVKVPYPPNAKYIYVGGILGKGGTAWFDDFMVKIDGKDIQTLEETKRLTLKDFNTADLSSALSKSSVQMDISNPETWHKSLDELIAKVGDKKIVAIGESTHGTSEFYQLREIITKRLIQEKGFNLVVLESPYDDIEVFNKELDTSPIDSLMRKHLFSIYQTEEMKSFLQWYKDNRTKYAVEFKGCDDSLWAFYELLSDKVAPMKDIKLNNLLKHLELNISTSETDDGKKEINLKNGIYNDILAIENQLKVSGKLTDSLEEILFNGKNSYINYVHLKDKQPIQSRDEIMAERISYLANQSDNKIIVWAHNAHISKEVISDNEIGLMGYYLKKEFKEDYYAVGLLTLQGTYSYMGEKYIHRDHDYIEKLKTEKLLSSEYELWENKLAEMGSSTIVDTSILKKELSPDAIIGPTKLVGYGKEKETDIYFIPLIKHFDCLIFIENTNATTPIFR
ncbi:erythromycin esterase family protein [uncultured Algoriphagus sp.]|uniref:erythromycin esterase family protein n=1 Tax=uncultured Algoriphagus sp. TaxID=417365 RepID=UPI0030EC3A0B|tara:strand:- start:7528 stop:9300 length:1773 start_codon:yes stop_codon:yes gene_type:complete